MPTYIGLVNYQDKDGEAELRVGRAARQLVEVHGGRILSTYWTEGDCQMIIAFEGRGEEQAMKVYDDLASQQDVDIRMVSAPDGGGEGAFFFPLSIVCGSQKLALTVRFAVEYRRGIKTRVGEAVT